MLTKLTTYYPDGTTSETELELEAKPGLDAIRAALRPIFGEAYTEHVSVLADGQRADLFVDEDGHAKGLEWNEAATAIYRANWLSQHPKTDPASLPGIVGPAVLFSRRVWF